MSNDRKISIEERDRLVAAENNHNGEGKPYGDFRVALADGVAYPSDYCYEDKEGFYWIEPCAIEWARRAHFHFEFLD